MQFGLEERFWKNVDKKSGKCWNWIGSLFNTGYGQFYIGYKQVLAHRFSWELSNGSIPKGNGYHGTCVLHKCDNILCVKPSHLFLGTQQDNMKDKVKKNRQVKGEATGNSKLTEKEVLKIRELYSKGNISLRKLGKEFNVHHNLIHRIINRTYWKHI